MAKREWLNWIKEERTGSTPENSEVSMHMRMIKALHISQFGSSDFLVQRNRDKSL